MWLVPSFTYWKAGCEGYDVTISLYPVFYTTAMMKRSRTVNFISYGAMIWELSDGWCGDLVMKCKSLWKNYNRPPAFLIPVYGPGKYVRD